MLESVGENFDINFMIKEFPADKQFILWWINLEQRMSAYWGEVICVIFFFWGCLKDKAYSSNPRMEGLKENIRREISNIPAENLQKVNQNLFRRCEECCNRFSVMIAVPWAPLYNCSSTAARWASRGQVCWSWVRVQWAWDSVPGLNGSCSGERFPYRRSLWTTHFLK
jgi:hypothetical protein